MFARAIRWSVFFAFLLPLWFLLVNQFPASEILAGAAAAALGATASEAIRACEHPAIHPDFPALAGWHRLPARVAKDTALLVRNLLGGRGTGHFRTIELAEGSDAFAILMTSLPPNSIAIGREGNRLLVHVLEEAS